MTQQKVTSVPGSTQNGKRIIHLKRPSTNVQVLNREQPTNQALVAAKTIYNQRAASRVDQSDRTNDLSFVSNPANITTGSPGAFSMQQAYGAKPLNDERVQQPQIIVPSNRTGVKKLAAGTKI